MDINNISDILIPIISFVFGAGGFWGYFKTQNNKVESLLSKRVTKLEKDLEEANKRIEYQQNQITVLTSGLQITLGIAKYNYNELPEELQSQLVKVESKVDSILAKLV